MVLNICYYAELSSIIFNNSKIIEYMLALIKEINSLHVLNKKPRLSRQICQ